MVTSSLNWLRFLILCLSMVSVIMGIVLRARTGLYYDLNIIIASNALAIILYVIAICISKKDHHYRLLGIGLRIAMSVSALFVPARALANCSFEDDEPAWSKYRWLYNPEQSQCPGLYAKTYLEERVLRPTYDLLKALLVVALVASLLMVVELLSYWRSDERSGCASREVKVELRVSVQMDSGNKDSSV